MLVTADCNVLTAFVMLALKWLIPGGRRIEKFAHKSLDTPGLVRRNSIGSKVRCISTNQRQRDLPSVWNGFEINHFCINTLNFNINFVNDQTKAKTLGS